MNLIIIYACYKPNTAPTNRFLSFLKGFDELGIVVEVAFVYPSENRDLMDSDLYSSCKVSYLWSGRGQYNKQVKYLLSFLDVWRYCRKIPSNSRVILFGSGEYLPFFVSRKDLMVYQERTEHFEVAPLRPRVLQKRYLRSISKLNGMFVISTTLREAYRAAGVKNVKIVNMTVDANRFSRLIKDGKSEKYIAYCGAATNNKDGVDDLIKAFAEVHRLYPDIKLYIMGKTSAKEDSAGNLALVKDLGLSSFVVFKGVIPASEMPQMLVNAKIVALARPDSLQARCGFPTKLGEYLLSGNPVVVTRVGDIPLFLEDGKTALLANQRDPKNFAEKLLWALDHEKEAEVIGQAGREVALRHFNYKIETEKIVNTIFPD